MKVFFLALAALLIPAALLGARDAGSTPGVITVESDVRTIPVHVTANTPLLQNLARVAFNANGRYRLVAGGGYDLNFSAVSANEVRVDIAKNGAPVASRTVTGRDLRNALLRAADFAVEQTSGQRGFFASRLAFISDRTGHREVYTSDLFFGDIRQLTHDNALALTPRWSPDGTRILYTSYYRSGFPDIFLIDLATMQRTTFVSFKGTNSGARFSPDGARVAMVLSGAGNSDIYTGDAGGHGLRRLTHPPGVKATPSWSPNGAEMVFTSDQAGGPQLYVISSAGGPARRLPTNISGYCAEPAWCPANADEIAFTAGFGRGYQIAVYKFSTRTSEQVSHAPMDAIEPAWLADGRHLIYTARTGRGKELYILDTESGKATRISPAGMGSCSEASVLRPRE